MGVSSKRSRRRPLRAWFLRWMAVALAAWVAVSVVLVLPWRWLAPPTTSFMLQSQRRGEAVDFRWRDWRRISPHAAVAVVAAEDQRFADHWGLDLRAIRDAVRERVERGRVRGASTLTQQVAKNLFLWPGHSLLRKAMEAQLAVVIDLLWPKQRILEVYLNIAQFGPGVFGVEAAARSFFAHSAQRLTAGQGALLAAVLPNPYQLKPAAPSRYLRQRRDAILRQMELLGGVRYLERLQAGGKAATAGVPLAGGDAGQHVGGLAVQLDELLGGYGVAQQVALDDVALGVLQELELALRLHAFCHHVQFQRVGQRNDGRRDRGTGFVVLDVGHEGTVDLQGIDG